MKKVNLKKAIALLLSVVMLIAGLAACKTDGEEPSGEPDSGSSSDISQASSEETPEEEPVRVFVEWDSFMSSDIKNLFDNAANWIGMLGGPKNVEFDWLPSHEYPSDRQASLTHIKTEIMAGGGPDVFLCTSDFSFTNDVLFRYPEQAMKRNIFMPLDDYIPTAKYMEWDKLLPQIMEAGKNEYGQVVLPTTWTIPLTLFRKTEVEHEYSQTMTFWDMVEGDDVLRLSAVPFDSNDPVQYDHCRITNVFRELGDYSSDSLAFTEEELLDVMRFNMEMDKGIEAGEYVGSPQRFKEYLRLEYTLSASDGVWYYGTEGKFGGLDPRDTTTMVPVYNTEGGYIANVTTFAAINANCKDPQAAFYVLDYIMSTDNQGGSLYWEVERFCGFPTNMELGRDETQLSHNWSMTEENFAEYEKLRENISSVRFCCKLDQYLSDLYWNCLMEPDNIEKLVKETYSEMRMDIAES